MRKNPFNPKEDKMHNGTDFGIPEGTPTPSPVDGKVTLNDFNELNGNRLQVTDKNGVQHNFLHLQSKPNIPTGAPIKQGEIIGNSGNTGSSTNPHLYYQAGINGKPTPPNKKDIDFLDNHFSNKLGCK
jgi:murein DD-endopeptidase